MAGQIGREYPAGYCYALLAMSGAVYPHRELLCTGRTVPDEVRTYIKTNPAHDLSILYKSAENEKELARLAPFTGPYPVSARPVFYLCENNACRAPKTDFHKLDL